MAKLKVDFTGVESFVKCEEGEHVIAVKDIEEKQSSNGNEMLSFKWEVVAGNSTGATLYDNFVLTEKALWKLKSVLSVLGVKADGKIAIDTDKLVGKRCIAVVGHEEYNGKIQNRITDYKKLVVIEEDPTIDEEEDWEEA